MQWQCILCFGLAGIFYVPERYSILVCHSNRETWRTKTEHYQFRLLPIISMHGTYSGHCFSITCTSINWAEGIRGSVFALIDMYGMRYCCSAFYMNTVSTLMLTEDRYYPCSCQWWSHTSSHWKLNCMSSLAMFSKRWISTAHSMSTLHDKKCWPVLQDHLMIITDISAQSIRRSNAEDQEIFTTPTPWQIKRNLTENEEIPDSFLTGSISNYKTLSHYGAWISIGSHVLIGRLHRATRLCFFKLALKLKTPRVLCSDVNLGAKQQWQLTVMCKIHSPTQIISTSFMPEWPAQWQCSCLPFNPPCCTHPASFKIRWRYWRPPQNLQNVSCFVVMRAGLYCHRPTNQVIWSCYTLAGD